jgi:hypothetical protein
VTPPRAPRHRRRAAAPPHRCRRVPVFVRALRRRSALDQRANAVARTLDAKWRVHARTRCPHVTAPSAKQGTVEGAPVAEEAPVAEVAEAAEAAEAVEAAAEAEKPANEAEPADETATSPKKSAKSKKEAPAADAAEAKSPAKKARVEKKKQEEDDNDDGDASPSKTSETAYVRFDPCSVGRDAPACPP